MGWIEGIHLINAANRLYLPLLQEREAEALSILEKIGSTVAINSLRALDMQRAVIVCGTCALFEGAIQQHLIDGQSTEPMPKRLSRFLSNDQNLKFEEFWLAYNTLKHGAGRSYQRLLDSETLPFRLSDREEGNVTQTHLLIDVDDKFIEDLCDLLDEVTLAVLENCEALD